MTTLVKYAVERGIARITLDSPHNRNALSSLLVQQLIDSLAAAAAEDGVRAVVLTHTGTTFCAGADLGEAAAAGGLKRGTAELLAILNGIVEMPKPVVGVIDGNVRAGGMGLVGACDIVVASSTSSFGFTEVRLGLAPAIISLTTLGRMTERSASRYYLTGETFSAATAERNGLISEAVPDIAAAEDALLAALRLCSPQGLAESKPIVTRDTRAAIAAYGDEVMAMSARLFGSDEVKEGMASFLEKRPPRWAEV
ncbi:enoyl-CoA hydratase family protein [Nocardioides speluncae]|uniref:enoyl-CoA hydratase family protein n=1 Tax=Nocardioides speluncae TaxID=2670337 RepID=UPI000D690E9A|nr:enoyl-CoA hydratase family protein [Nocardioides speluncae]